MTTGHAGNNKPMPSMSQPDPMFSRDLPDWIGKALGGREFFFNAGAVAIHRIGIFDGLGWRLPFGEGRDGINYVKVEKARDGTLTLSLGKGERAGNLDEQPTFELIRKIEGLTLQTLRAAYEENA